MKDDTKIERLKLSTRAYNCLKAGGINTWGRLMEVKDNLLSFRQLGVKSREEILDKIKKYDK